MGRLSPPSGKYVALVLSGYTAVDFSSSSTGQPTNIAIPVFLLDEHIP